MLTSVPPANPHAQVRNQGLRQECQRLVGDTHAVVGRMAHTLVRTARLKAAMAAMEAEAEGNPSSTPTGPGVVETAVLELVPTLEGLNAQLAAAVASCAARTSP